MIILNDKKYPKIILIIDTYHKLEYKTLKKNMEYINERSIKDDCKIDIFVDLYNLTDYSTKYVSKTINYFMDIKDSDYSNINSIKVYLNQEKTGLVTEAFIFVNNNVTDNIVEIIQINKPFSNKDIKI